MIHSTRLKRIINPILRKIQFWTFRPYVIVSIFEKDENKNFIFKKYGFKSIHHISKLKIISCSMIENDTYYVVKTDLE